MVMNLVRPAHVDTGIDSGRRGNAVAVPLAWLVGFPAQPHPGFSRGAAAFAAVAPGARSDQVVPSVPTAAGLRYHVVEGVSVAAAVGAGVAVALQHAVAGAAAFGTLCDRARPLGIEVIALEADRGDFNADLMTLGRQRMIGSLRSQLRTADRSLLL